jgi:uncharacterized iron-regulated membrane protein
VIRQGGKSLTLAAIMAFAGSVAFVSAEAPHIAEQSIEAGKASQQVERSQVQQKQRQAAQRQVEQSIFGGMYRSLSKRRFPNGPGWTHAHAKRMARKRRNKQRNRRAQRGAR